MSQSNSGNEYCAQVKFSNEHKRRSIYDNVISYAHIPFGSWISSEAKRSDVPCGQASMMLGEGSETTEPYNKYGNLLFKQKFENNRCYEILSNFEKA